MNIIFIIIEAHVNETIKTIKDIVKILEKRQND